MYITAFFVHRNMIIQCFICSCLCACLFIHCHIHPLPQVSNLNLCTRHYTKRFSIQTIISHICILVLI